MLNRRIYPRGMQRTSIYPLKIQSNISQSQIRITKMSLSIPGLIAIVSCHISGVMDCSKEIPPLPSSFYENAAAYCSCSFPATTVVVTLDPTPFSRATLSTVVSSMMIGPDSPETITASPSTSSDVISVELTSDPAAQPTPPPGPIAQCVPNGDFCEVGNDLCCGSCDGYNGDTGSCVA